MGFLFTIKNVNTAGGWKTHCHSVMITNLWTFSVFGNIATYPVKLHFRGKLEYDFFNFTAHVDRHLSAPAS